MGKEWNKEEFFSGITEDYSNYKWYNGEKSNPYQNDVKRPLAASLWEYEKEFHYAFLDRSETGESLSESYKHWKENLLKEYLPGKSPNPEGDKTDWEKSFETGKREA
ncbi:hypothetical protein M2451_002538 [Dysgonomonas sp. PFB1-18]|uniref:hypothetical protein n=1 Tax=unclassified Dysgonomonas TaxID=2630389 RepID=UPI0024745352|nr:MULTISPECIES: hypothetical protein [unclassified Dysgonomonas]MDH6308019.1 hypothetical protein [Dysgonomonas sp. PF1-14]MDH6339558.1 hypothetical protein [Dysgonomonas sp. PF1-16]MDH6381209.1 hypothetical protein [Dysgonomonas sp. PFB1-18]MDH6398421.1 hypothetical protein [Dysgonomonas sp. PF1-23]